MIVLIRDFFFFGFRGHCEETKSLVLPHVGHEESPEDDKMHGMATPSLATCVSQIR